MTANSHVRRLLVISYHFPPDGAIGGQRWAGLSKYLARMGWEVHVVTSAAGLDEPVPNVHRHFRRRRRTLNDVYRAAALRVRQRSGNDLEMLLENASRRRSTSSWNPIEAVRKILGTAIYLPDDGRGWLFAAAGAARALLRERQFDAVVTSGPPHSAHLAGLAATIGRDVQFWIDMRDPWSVTHRFGLPHDRVARAERFVLRQLENLVFPRATRVIVNTTQFHAALAATEPEMQLTCLPNGIDLELLPQRNVGAVERGSVAYVGTLYFGRNLSSVCDAMRLLLSEKPRAAEKLILNVAGPMEPRHRRQFEDEITAAGLTSVVKIHGLLPRSQALDLLNRSHLSLVLAQDQPLQVPAKLYESVGLGVPTLVIAEEGSASAHEARRVGAMTLDGADVGGLRSLLDDLLADRIPAKMEARTPISYAHLAQEWDYLLRKSARAVSGGVHHQSFAPTI